MRALYLIPERSAAVSAGPAAARSAGRWAEYALRLVSATQPRSFQPEVRLSRIWLRIRLAIFILAAGVGAVASVLSAQPDGARPLSREPASWAADYQPSGDPYDWHKTGQPERPWFHK